ncbi:MAG: S8 family serine peptidase, partial [Myxococcota bacterium]
THRGSKSTKCRAVAMGDADAAELSADPMVAWVEEDAYVYANDIQTDATWGLDRVDQRDLPLDDIYDYPADGTGVNAYIIDTGVLTTHEDFGGRATSGFDFVDNDDDATDCNGHGTHVAGTVGSATWGVAKNVNLIGVRVLSCSGGGTLAGVIAGIDWVTDNHVKPAVANMSLGGGASDALDEATRRSIAAGVTHVVAGGNSNANACNFSPARTQEAVTVGSTTRTDARSGFSNFGPCLDLFAPGSNITSTWYTDDTATNTISGTSMAAPHVAGAIALFLESNPDATPEQARNAVVSFGSLGRISNAGNGSPNTMLYVQMEQEPDNEPPVVAITRPTNGEFVYRVVSVEANVTDNANIESVRLLVDGQEVDSRGMPARFSWDSRAVADGVYTLQVTATDFGGNSASDSIQVTVDNANADTTLANYEPNFATVACLMPTAVCDTTDLLEGRGTLGPEENAPNTLFSSCADGNSGSYQSDESLERIVLSSQGNFAPGGTLNIDVDVWAWSGFQQDSLDLFHATDANAPEWTFLTTLKPTASGPQTLSFSLTLPDDGASLQAIRGQYRYQGNDAPCASGAYIDRDDVVFLVGDEVEPEPVDGTAMFDAEFLAPMCDSDRLRSCSTGDLLGGRGTMSGGSETSAPNTLFSSCADGNLGTYQNDESIEAIRIRTVDDAPFAAGSAVSVEVDVWAWLNGSSDSLDLWHAADAAAPEWTLIGTTTPDGGDAQTLSLGFTLPEGGARQAIRAVFRYRSSPGACVPGGYTDRDDLVFSVGR